MGLLPEYWSVEMLSEFLVRSLRQSYHDYREGQILKGLCRGENTMVISFFYEKHLSFQYRTNINSLFIDKF